MTLGSINTPIEGSEIDVSSIVASATEHISLDGGGVVDIPNGALTISGATSSWSIDGRNAPNKMEWAGQTAGIGIDVTAGSVLVSGSDSNDYSIRTTNRGVESQVDDAPAISVGGNNDFIWEHDSVPSSTLVLRDSNNVELIRQPKAGPTQFLQGIDAGSIEAPEDSFTQLANASVTSALTAGDRVGYTFALDNQTFLAIDGEADGSGGIQNTDVTIPNGDLDVSNGVVNANSGFDSTSGNIRIQSNGQYNFYATGRSINASGDGDIEIRSENGDPSASIDLYDNTNDQDILRANNGGNVEIPNGDLDISGNALSNASTISASSSLFSIVSDGGGSSRITLFDGANIQAILEAKEGGDVDIPNGNLTVAGNVTVEDNTFQISNSTSGDDFKIFPTGDDFEFRTFDSSVGSAVRFFQLDASNSRMEMFNGIDMGGNTLTSVGGTTDASTGAIRLANNNDISWRNSGDTDDHIISFNNNDVLIAEANGNRLFTGTIGEFRLQGNSLTQVGGTTDASAGAIRLANNKSINARNSTDDGDFGISFTSSDTISMDNADVEIPAGDLSFGTAGTISASSGATSMAIDPGSVVFDAGGSTVMTLTNVELTLSEPVVTTSDVEVGGRLDLSAGALMSLPQVGGDPPANAGDMWYRTDLD